MIPNVHFPPNGQSASRASVSKWITVFAILAALILLSGSGDQSPRRALIINSDDAGMSSSVNHGTISALQAGLLKSTSIMVCCPGFEEFAEFARSHSQYDYGVHLTLTCDLRAAGWGSVSPASEVPSLLDREGFFPISTSAVALSANVAEVEAELRAQIRKALDAGIRITHLDHHMWVLYARSDLLSLYVRLGIEFGLPIRFSREPPAKFLDFYDDAPVGKYMELVNDLENAGFPLLDQIEYKSYSIEPIEKRNFFLNDFRNTPQGVTEIVIHCANPDASGFESPDLATRYADAACFSTREFRDELSRLRIDLLDWREFKNRKR